MYAIRSYYEIKSYNLAQLLMQLRFTPEKKRQKQLDAAEGLFAIIDRDKEYPFEFICYRITGYHPKSPERSELIKGNELLEDVITSYSIHYTKLYDSRSRHRRASPTQSLPPSTPPGAASSPPS